MEEIAVGPALSLVQEMLSFLRNQEGHLKKKLNEEIQDCKRWLESLQAYLRDKEGTKGSELLNNQVKGILDVSYDIKEVLDISMLHMPHQHHRVEIFNRVHNAAHDIWHRGELDEISSRMVEIKGKIDHIKTFIGNPTTETGSSSVAWTENQVTHFPEDGDIVGFVWLREELDRQLQNGEPRCLIISLVGPSGSGKTTVVWNVYDGRRVREYFHCHAWINVSRSFIYNDSNSIKKLLGNMLEQFCASREEPIPPGNIDPVIKLRKYLDGKSYVVVLDDVCSRSQLESIKNALPNGNGSIRCIIIVTTRNSNVASYCVTPEFTNCIHDLSTGLQWKEAYDLFCRNAFRNQYGKCPLELKDLSEKIVKKCEGLPVAIRAVGALLSDSLRRQDQREWESFHDNLGSGIATNPSLERMLLSTYEDIPRKNKGCFFYFSIFPEDYSIKRGRLVRLWSAEGLVPVEGTKTPEEVAEECLYELIRRNLVHVDRMDFDGRARSCRLRNLLLDFIVQKSEEEGFVLVSGRKTFSGDKVRRLSVYNSGTTLSECTGLSSVRSAFFFRWDDAFPRMMEDTLRICKFLTVLDLEGAPLEKFPEDVVNLTLLKYLSLKDTKITVIPESIKKLLLLETLDLRRTGVNKLPKNICYLRHLRHLLVYVHNETTFVTFNTVKPVKMFAGIGSLHNLQKLLLVRPHRNFKIVKELKALKQLRKLGFILVKEEDGKDLWASIQQMEKLRTLDVSSSSEKDHLALEDSSDPPFLLERLYLKGRLRDVPNWISNQTNLYRIGLKWSKLNASPLGALQDLPHLTELEMVDACTESELVFRAGKFSKLKILHIEQFNQLDMVKIEEGAMPHLQKLTLHKCPMLTMSPLGIHHLSRLEELLLYAMSEEFINRIQNADREMVRHIPFVKSFTLTEGQRWVSQKLRF